MLPLHYRWVQHKKNTKSRACAKKKSTCMVAVLGCVMLLMTVVDRLSEVEMQNRDEVSEVEWTMSSEKADIIRKMPVWDAEWNEKWDWGLGDAHNYWRLIRVELIKRNSGIWCTFMTPNLPHLDLLSSMNEVSSVKHGAKSAQEMRSEHVWNWMHTVIHHSVEQQNKQVPRNPPHMDFSSIRLDKNNNIQSSYRIVSEYYKVSVLYELGSWI